MQGDRWHSFIDDHWPWGVTKGRKARRGAAGLLPLKRKCSESKFPRSIRKEALA